MRAQQWVVYLQIALYAVILLALLRPGGRGQDLTAGLGQAFAGSISPA
jgi:hypothetical protein